MNKNLISKIQNSLNGFNFPSMVLLDITNVCNLKCIHCPQPLIQNRKDFKANHLPLNLFLKLIEEISSSNFPFLLRFLGDGEPMLHPNIIEMIEIAKSKTNCTLNLTTNGIFLTPEKSDILLEIGIDIIDISIDALTKKTYEKIRKNGSFEKLMSNIFYLINKRNKINSNTKIIVSFIKQDENYLEEETFTSYWETIVNYVMIRDLHSANNLIKKEESFLRNNLFQTKRYPCPHLWKRLHIDFKGNIKFCATDWEIGSIIGNIGEKSLESIWKSDFMNDLRKSHMNDTIKDNSICKKCIDWASTKWDWGYERLVDKLVFNKPTLSPELPILD